MNTKIYLSPPHIIDKEQQYINQAFKSNWIAPIGENINKFEDSLQHFLNTKKSVTALNSGTSAIHLALHLLNISKDDIVICQTNSFIATANPVMYTGAQPIFIDSEADTWNMCPFLLEEAINDCIKQNNKPKAIIAVHIFGMPYNIEAITKISKQYNIPIIEDAAPALGSGYKNEKCGTFGDYACFSFNGNKIITTSAGGALITNSKTEKAKSIHIATQAKESNTDFIHSTIAYNYRMSNILAGIGRGQIKHIDTFINLRRRNYDFYHQELKDYGIIFQKEQEHYFSNRWLTTIILENEELKTKILNHLANNNIESRSFYKPIHTQKMYCKNKSYTNGTAEDLHKRGLSLPSGSSLSESDLERVILTIKQVL